MATLLEEYITKERLSVVRFSMAKSLSEKDILMFPMLRSVCRVKRFHLGGKCFVDNKEAEKGVQNCLRTTVKRLLYCGFRRTNKAMGQV
jgi:hypothetical protein